VKGAEVVRMMHTLVGREGFARGMALYFQRHDGQAVTCDDFAQAIADANPDSGLAPRLEAFKRWYAQAGTPHLSARGHYDAEKRRYTLVLAQHGEPSPGQPTKQPFVIPVVMGLVAHDGRELLAEQLLVLDTMGRTFVFEDIASPPVPSLLRGFSSPVVLDDGLADAELLVLLAHDRDPFNRWEAGQRLALRRMVAALDEESPPALDDPFVDAMRGVLQHPVLDPAFKELVLTLPGEGYVAEQLKQVDPPRIHAVREHFRAELAARLHEDWAQAFEAHAVHEGYAPTPAQAGRRALSNLALSMLCLHAARGRSPVWPGRAYQRVKDASNMTERLGALAALVDSRSELADAALARFLAGADGEALVIDKWFMVQAGACDGVGDGAGRVFARVKTLLQHPDFTLRNPNRARSLLFPLCTENPAAFHRADAAGYVFWAERLVELDALNPQLAARLARAMDRWSALVEPYRSAAREAIVRVAARSELSDDVREIVTRALESGE